MGRRSTSGTRLLFRILTWCCVVTLAVLSLLPAEEMVRTGVGHHIEHSRRMPVPLR